MINKNNHAETYEQLRNYYVSEIKKACIKYGYEKLSLQFGHALKFASRLLSDAEKKPEMFTPLRKFYAEIKEVYND